jgi:hypothetical protein
MIEMLLAVFDTRVSWFKLSRMRIYCKRLESMLFQVLCSHLREGTHGEILLWFG